MSKFCTQCGAKLSDDDLFCGECGAKQPNDIVATDDAPTHQENEQQLESSASPKVVQEPASIVGKESAHTGGRKKGLLAAIGIIGLVAILIFVFIPKGKKPPVDDAKNTGLITVDEIEQKLNDMYRTYADNYSGVSDFQIKNVNESTHDQTFSCFMSQSDDGVTGFRVIGLVKDKKVIQLQSVSIGAAESFNQLNDAEKTIVLALTAFPINLYRPEIDSIEDVLVFLKDMEPVNDTGDNMRTIDGDIEYTYMSSVGSELAVASFNIRYLPAFSNGFFEDGDGLPIDDDVSPTQAPSINTDLEASNGDKGGAFFENENQLMVYSDNPGYYIELNIYRLTHIEGTGTADGDNIIFTGTDANGNPITMELVYSDDNSQIELTVTDSTWDYLPNGELFVFAKDDNFSTAP